MHAIPSPFSSTAFAGKRALITGAAGGIGHATAQLLVAGGAELILTDLHPEPLQRVADALGDSGITTLHGDLNLPETRAQLVSRVEELGGLDFLIPAAGIYPEASIGDITDEEWDRVFLVNVTAVFSLTRDLEPYLRTNGSVINFGSIAGARGSANHSHYAASKGAIASFSRSIAREWGPKGIRVNTIAPGIIDTQMTRELMTATGDAILSGTPLKRLGTAEEVAATVAFLCTDLAAFITGETINVNGGFHMA